MGSVNEAIVREYFESLGYLVGQPCKHVAPGRRKRADEAIDLLAVNPLVAEHRIPAQMVWTSADLKTVARAIVGIYGWHTGHFSLSRFDKTPEILDFAGEKAFDVAAKRLGTRDLARVLCVPHLPPGGDSRNRTLKALKDKGIDGVLSFRTMLQELITRVATNKNYEKSDVLQVIRILKNYDLLRDSQMELFGKSRRRKMDNIETQKG